MAEAGLLSAVRLRPHLRFRLATSRDDAPLRELLRDTAMAGSVEVAFLREPSYFAAAAIAGTTVETLVARDSQGIVAVGTRALRPTFMNGEKIQAGYLGDLRLRPEYRGTTLLARGYRFLRELDRDGRASVYSTVIMSENRRALDSLARNRADLPRYRDQGRILTPIISLGRALPERLRRHEAIERGRPQTLDEIVSALNRNRLQFAPAYTGADFLGGRFPRFLPRDFRVLRRNGRIAAVLGVWDQRPFRQTVAMRYHGLAGALLPIVNIFRRPPLPAAGTSFRYAYLAFLYSEDVESFRTLIRHVYNEVAAARRERDLDSLLIGLHESDPRLAILDDFRSTPFAGRLFSVSFGEPYPLDGRVPFMEAALL